MPKKVILQLQAKVINICYQNKSDNLVDRIKNRIKKPRKTKANKEEGSMTQWTENFLQLVTLINKQFGNISRNSCESFQNDQFDLNDIQSNKLLSTIKSINQNQKLNDSEDENLKKWKQETEIDTPPQKIW